MSRVSRVATRIARSAPQTPAGAESVGPRCAARVRAGLARRAARPSTRAWRATSRAHRAAPSHAQTHARSPRAAARAACRPTGAARAPAAYCAGAPRQAAHWCGQASAQSSGAASTAAGPQALRIPAREHHTYLVRERGVRQRIAPLLPRHGASAGIARRLPRSLQRAQSVRTDPCVQCMPCTVW